MIMRTQESQSDAAELVWARGKVVSCDDRQSLIVESSRVWSALVLVCLAILLGAAIWLLTRWLLALWGPIPIDVASTISIPLITVAFIAALIVGAIEHVRIVLIGRRIVFDARKRSITLNGIWIASFASVHRISVAIASDDDGKPTKATVRVMFKSADARPLRIARGSDIARINALADKASGILNVARKEEAAPIVGVIAWLRSQ
jgi:hypothetical protein